MNGEQLHEAFRAIREQIDDEDHRTRLHRAIRWLECAEQYADTDEDMSFLALWISFNACYAIDDDGARRGFWVDFATFAGKLVRYDGEEKIYNCLWFNFSNFIRVLIDNHWVYEPFWESLRNGDENWKESFERSRKSAYRALANNDVPGLLTIVMERLYTLRNQMVHGGATWQSDANRDQVRDGKRMLLELMPTIIEIMLHEHDGWGRIHYPYVSG